MSAQLLRESWSPVSGLPAPNLSGGGSVLRGHLSREPALASSSPSSGLPLDPVWPPRASPGSALHISLTLPGPRPPPSPLSPWPLSGPWPPACPRFVHSGHQEGWVPLLFLPHAKEAKSLPFLDLQVPNRFSEVLQLSHHKLWFPLTSFPQIQ